MRKPVRAATAPRLHQGQGPKPKPELEPPQGMPQAPTGQRSPHAPRPQRRESGGAPPSAPRQEILRPDVRTLARSDKAQDARPRRDDRGPASPVVVAPKWPGITRTIDAPTATTVAGEERISKRLATLGLASRREADAWIEAGWVSVNGRVAKLGDKVALDANIDIDPRAQAHQSTKVTILLHKPLDVVSGQAEDGHTPAVDIILRGTRWPQDRSERRFESAHVQGLAPAGRLDLDSTGLLVLTQDGRVAKQLIGDSADVEKEYIVHVDWRDPWAWSDQALERLRLGLLLDDVELKPAVVERLRSQDFAGVLRVVLKEGRKRQIRRMTELVGLRVTQLVRVRIGRIKLADLPLGQWRYLRDDERF